MNWNALTSWRSDTTDAQATPGSIRVYAVSPMRAALGPVLSLVNPTPPVSLAQRLMQWLAITTVGLVALAIPFVAFGYAVTELDRPTASTERLLPQTEPVTTPVTVYPSRLPLASPGTGFTATDTSR